MRRSSFARDNAMLKRNELLMEIYRQMLIVVRDQVQNKAAVLDIVQQSWIKVLLQHEKLKEPDQLIEWATFMVSNPSQNAHHY